MRPFAAEARRAGASAGRRDLSPSRPDYGNGRVHRAHRVDKDDRCPGAGERVPGGGPVQGRGRCQEGDMLFKIDGRIYLADLDRAKANLALARAHLTHMEANYKRAKNLISTHAISESDYDQAVGDRDEGEATVKVAEAPLNTADLNLDWTNVKAPISGRISRQLIDPGNMVKADETALTTIVDMDPIYACFDIDERVMQGLVRTGKLKSARDGNVKVRLGLADETGFPHVGTVDFIDNQVDMPTGTLRLRGQVPQSRSSPLTRHVCEDSVAGERSASDVPGFGPGTAYRPGEEVPLRRRRQKRGSALQCRDGNTQRRTPRHP